METRRIPDGTLVKCNCCDLVGLFYYPRNFQAFRDYSDDDFGLIIRDATHQETLDALNRFADRDDFFDHFTGRVDLAAMGRIEMVEIPHMSKHRRGKRHKLRSSSLYPTLEVSYAE